MFLEVMKTIRSCLLKWVKSAPNLLRPGRKSQRLQTGGMERVSLRRGRAGRLTGTGHASITEHSGEP